MNVTFSRNQDTTGHYRICKNRGPLVVGHIYREGTRWIAYDSSIGRFCGTDECTHRSLSAAQDAAEHFYRSRDYCKGGCGLMVGEWNFQRHGDWYCAACAADYGRSPQPTGHATDAITGGYADLLEYGDAI